MAPLLLLLLGVLGVAKLGAELTLVRGFPSPGSATAKCCCDGPVDSSDEDDGERAGRLILLFLVLLLPLPLPLPAWFRVTERVSSRSGEGRVVGEVVADADVPAALLALVLELPLRLRLPVLTAPVTALR